MNILYSTLLLLFSLFINDFPAQTHESKFVQFMMTNVDSREKVLEIDKFVRNQKGVEISRADFVSKKYLCIYESESGLDRMKIESWMQELGVEIKCFREGILGTDKVIDQKLDCE
tara:strand:+ start:346 stop:690 length:345 start_codon:yes stop_codon:yes gene_type:complete